MRITSLRIAAVTGGKVTATTTAGQFDSKRIIVTAPPLLAGRIEYEPALPHWREQLTQRVPMGSVIKCQVIYDEPFWRADGLSGQARGRLVRRVLFDLVTPGQRCQIRVFGMSRRGRSWPGSGFRR
jgi:monoamine oxidase